MLEIEHAFDHPPALNPNPPVPVPQQLASNSNSNMHPTLHHRTHEDFLYQNQCGTLCKYVGRVVMIAIQVLLTLALYLYFHYKPQPPKINFSSVSLHEANLDNTSKPFSYNITLHLNFSNPNHRVHLQLHGIVVTFVVAHTVVGTTNLPPLEMKVLDSHFFFINMFGRHVEIKNKYEKKLRDSMETDHYFYSLYIRARVKTTLGTSQISYRYRLFVLCVFEVGSPPDGILLLHNCETD